MSPRIFKEAGLVFWFHSYDTQHEQRASVHVGSGSQNDFGDAKIWIEPVVEVARPGRTLSPAELRRAVEIIERHHARLLEAWYAHRNRTS